MSEGVTILIGRLNHYLGVPTIHVGVLVCVLKEQLAIQELRTLQTSETWMASQIPEFTTHNR